jgi:hypothetical protein
MDRDEYDCSRQRTYLYLLGIVAWEFLKIIVSEYSSKFTSLVIATKEMSSPPPNQNRLRFERGSADAMVAFLGLLGFWVSDFSTH